MSTVYQIVETCGRCGGENRTSSDDLNSLPQLVPWLNQVRFIPSGSAAIVYEICPKCSDALIAWMDAK